MNLSLSKKLLLLTSGLCMLALVFAVWALYPSWQRLQSHDMLLDRLQLIHALEDIAHQHAVERGLSAGFLGSKGAKLGDQMRQQRGKADQVEKALRDLFREKESQLNSLAAKAILRVLSRLDQKSTIRQQIDQLNGRNAFSYYSHLNALALEGAEMMAGEVEHLDVRSQLSMAHTLLAMKERAGQERGAVNGVLAAKKSSPERFSQIQFYIAEQERLNDKFSLQASRTRFNHYTQSVNGDELQPFYRIRSQLLLQHDQLDSISGPEPSQWFALATQRIGAINEELVAMDEALQQQLQQTLSNLKQRLVMYMTGILLLAVVVIAVVRRIRVSMTRRILILQQVLNGASERGELNQHIDDQSGDELSDIADSINRLFTKVSNVVQRILETADSLGSSSSQLQQGASNNLEALSEQQLNTHQIASAVTQMAASIQEVAHSSEDVGALSKQAGSDSSQGYAKVNATAESIGRLVEELQQSATQVSLVAQQSEKIGSILDTIRGIAEQTNLLALNAAIEAARAGEQGRGFAVVADEVRSLAQRTQESTAEIQRMIEQLQSGSDAVQATMTTSLQHADACTKLSQESGELLQSIDDVVNRVADHMIQISAAAHEQSTVAEQIDQSSQQIAGQAEVSVGMAREVQHSAQDQRRQAEELLSEVAFFKVS